MGEFSLASTVKCLLTWGSVTLLICEERGLRPAPCVKCPEAIAVVILVLKMLSLQLVNLGTDF